MPLYDILNEFQKGSSHMAAVVKVREKEKKLPSSNGVREKNSTKGDPQLTIPLLYKHNGQPNSVVVSIDTSLRNGFMTYGSKHMAEDIEDGEVIGIITLEDVFEELLQVILVSYFSNFSVRLQRRRILNLLCKMVYNYLLTKTSMNLVRVKYHGLVCMKYHGLVILRTTAHESNHF